SQRTSEPGNGGASNGARSLRQDGVNRLVERLSVSFPEEFPQCAIRPRFDVVGHDSERPIQRSDGVGVTPQGLVTERDLLQNIKVAGVQLHRALQIAQTFLLLAAPPQNVAGEFEETWIIG